MLRWFRLRADGPIPLPLVRVRRLADDSTFLETGRVAWPGVPGLAVLINNLS